MISSIKIIRICFICAFSAWIYVYNGIIITISIQVEPELFCSAKQFITINKPLNRRVIVSALEVVESCLGEFNSHLHELHRRKLSAVLPCESEAPVSQRISYRIVG